MEESKEVRERHIRLWEFINKVKADMALLHQDVKLSDVEKHGILEVIKKQFQV